MPNLKCPECHTSMQKEASEFLRLDYCQSCKGWWFDATELDEYRRRLADELGGPQPSPHEFKILAMRTAHRCPRCDDDGLQLGSAAGIEVCHCAQCDGLYVSAANVKKLRSLAGPQLGVRAADPLRILDAAFVLSFFLDVPWD